MRATILGLILCVPATACPDDNTGQTPSEQVRAVGRDWDLLREKVIKDSAAATTGDARKKVQAEFVETAHALGKRALDVVRDHPKDPAAVDALLWLTHNALRPESSEAWKVLARDHLASDKIVPACWDSRRDVVANTVLAERFLREVIAKTPHREVRGQAYYALANFISFRAEALGLHQENPEDSLIAKLNAEDRAAFSNRPPDDLSKEAEDLYEKVAAEYPDLKDLRKRPLGDLAKGQLHEMRNLGIEKAPPGVARKPAPDIEGEDADGRRFKLSDYRGKVVVLTFSGNWCGPCRAMYPEERELVKSLKDKPFVLLSVNTDKEKETLKKSIDSGEVTWRCWWDGEPGGPIVTRWGIDGFPTIYILDHHGAIRYKALGKKTLREAVETLLKETENEAISSPAKTE